RFDDVPHALRFIECLAALPQSWNWTMVEKAIQGVAFLIGNGIESSEVSIFLARHQRLSELGFEEAEAEVVAESLIPAGAVGKQRKRVVNRLISMAGKMINAADLERERVRLEDEVMLLRKEKGELEASIVKYKNQQNG